MNKLLFLALPVCLGTIKAGAVPRILYSEFTSYRIAVDTTPSARNTTETGEEDKDENILSPLLHLNFIGNKKGLANLTPAIDYGYAVKIPITKGWLYKQKIFDEFSLGINPYVAGQIPVDDSVNFIPGLMLPGTAGLRIDPAFTKKWGDFHLTVFGGFGYKVITNFTDSSNTIFQHNLRTGIAMSLRDKFIFGVQYTTAAHNSTSAGEESFKSVLKKTNSSIRYVLMSLQTRLSKKTEETKHSDFLYIEWRGLLDRDEWKGLPNSRIVTVGFRKDLSLSAAMPAFRAKALLL
jgi:hypothetical protein